MTVEPFADDEIEAAPPPSDYDLKTVATLAVKQIEKRREVEEAAAALQLRQEELRTIEEVELPDALVAVGLTRFDLVGGGIVELEETYTASIPSGARTKDPAERARLIGQRERALAWLAEHHPDIIKREVELAFARGERSLADEAVDLLRKFFREKNVERKIADKEVVHAGTLGALVREQIAAGVDIPRDDLGVRHVRRAIVKLPE